MIKTIQCPECHDSLRYDQKRCSCGWRQIEIEKTSYSCRIVEANKPCGSKLDLINVGTTQCPVHWCLKHYDQRRKKSDIELEIESRAKVYSTAQKASGMSAKEFAYEILENYGVKSMFKKEDQIKQIKDILIKQNTQFALTTEVEN